MLNLLDKQMTMNKYYKNPIFGLLLLFLTTFLASFPMVLQAQVFPTSATVRLVPPYNTFLSELSQGNSDKVQVILLQRDQSVPSYDVRLKFKVKLAGNVIFETAPSFVSPIITLEQNTPIVLSGADLSAYFQANNLVFANANLRNIYVNNGQVPEGLYEFCATVYSATRADRQLSNNACQIFSLSRSLPPLLNLPACGGAIPEQNPLNLRFWWTPQHNSSVNSAANTSYVLEIFEIRNLDGNANNAVLSSSPVFTLPTPLTQYFCTMSDLSFIVGMRYAWRVRVIDDSNRDAFINNGYSAVCEFTYAPTLSNGQTLVPILAPSNIQAEGKGNRAGRVWWSAFAGAVIDKPDRYKVEYKKVGVGLEWFSEFTTTDELLINQGLEPATTYEARVQGEKGGFLGDASSIVTFTTFTPVAAVCGVTPTNTLANMTPMRNARIGMPIEVTGFEVVLDSLESESTPGVYSGRGLIKIPFMLNQTFTVLFESLFINELGQAGEGAVWFKTQPIDEWIATQQSAQQNAQQTANQEAFADTPFYDGVTTFDDNVITGVSVDTLGNVILNTTNGTFYADTTLVPRSPRDKAVIIQDKNGNQWVIQPNGSVVAAPGGGLPPKKNEDEDIASMVGLDPNKPYYFRIDTTKTQIGGDTTRYFNSQKAYLVKDSANVSVSIYRMNDPSFRSDSVTWKMRRNKGLGMIKPNINLAVNSQKCIISIKEAFSYDVKAYQKGKVITYFKLQIYDKPIVEFKTFNNYNGEFGFDDGHKFISKAVGLRNFYGRFNIYGDAKSPHYASNLSVVPNQLVQLKIKLDGLNLARRDNNFVLKFVRSNSLIEINGISGDTIRKNYQDLMANPTISIRVLASMTNNAYTIPENIQVFDYKNNLIGKLQIFCKALTERKILFIYVAHTQTVAGNPIYPTINRDSILVALNNRSFNQCHIRWVEATQTQLLGNNAPYNVLRNMDVSSVSFSNSNADNTLGKLLGLYKVRTLTGNNSADFSKYDYGQSEPIDFFFISEIPITRGEDKYVAGIHKLGGNYGALFDKGGVKEAIHELGHGLSLEHTFSGDKDRDNSNLKIPQSITRNYMDYFNTKTMFFLYQIQKVQR